MILEKGMGKIMYKIDEDLKDEFSGGDYYSMFIKRAIKELKNEGKCYVFSNEQINEIKKYIKLPIIIIENECGYTIKIVK